MARFVFTVFQGSEHGQEQRVISRAQAAAWLTQTRYRVTGSGDRGAKRAYQCEPTGDVSNRAIVVSRHALPICHATPGNPVTCAVCLRNLKPVSKPVVWTDETGHERGVCKCGNEPSTHPHDTNGGLDRCPNCYAVTCAACRGCCA
jgi:hypothetical protein